MWEINLNRLFLDFCSLQVQAYNLVENSLMYLACPCGYKNVIGQSRLCNSQDASNFVNLYGGSNGSKVSPY